MTPPPSPPPPVILTAGTNLVYFLCCAVFYLFCILISIYYIFAKGLISVGACVRVTVTRGAVML